MSLDKTTLKLSIKQAFLDEYTGTISSEQTAAIDRIATKISNACDTFVKTGTVSVNVTVSTTGTAAAQTGTGTGTGTIS